MTEILSLLAGIRPIRPSSFDQDEGVGGQILDWTLPGGRIGPWGLPGHGEARPYCGTFYSNIAKGCLNVEEHTQTFLVGENLENKVFIKHSKRSCKRVECPICYEKAIAREAKRASKRIDSSKYKRRPSNHFMVSPPRRLWGLPLGKLREEAYKIAKKAGVWGGSCITHHLRQHELIKQWYFSPHFHIVGFGWIKNTPIMNTGLLYQRTGWIVKNLGVRKSISATIMYQLSHCAVWYGEGKRHVLTWFGSLSYNKFKTPVDYDEKELCPLCHSVLEPVRWVGKESMPHFGEEGIFWVNVEGWVRIVSYRFRGSG